jgi:hypothetical protein
VSAAGIPNAAPTGVVTPEGPVLHDIPGRRHCFRCHNRGGDIVLGFDALLLTPLTENSPDGSLTLDTLMTDGRLSHPLPVRPQLPAASEGERRILGYLHVNCAHCHNAGGAVSYVGMDLRFSVKHQVEGKRQPALTTTLDQLATAIEPPGTT